MKTIKAFTSLLAAATLALSACGASDSAAVVVGASPVPHAQILKYVKENLAKKAGIEIEIKEYQDYNVPNSALKDGDIDANFFQHLPYLKEASSSKGYKFNHGTGVHIEPYGIYSKKIKDLKKLPKNAQVAITDDPSNQARALELLAKNGIITLPKDKKATIYNVEKNPKNITFKPAGAPSIPKILPDVDIAIINGNYALENGLKPSKDAIYLESGEGNPYANILAWNSAPPARRQPPSRSSTSSSTPPKSLPTSRRRGRTARSSQPSRRRTRRRGGRDSSCPPRQPPRAPSASEPLVTRSEAVAPRSA